MKKEEVHNNLQQRVQACFKGNDVRCLYEKELDIDLAYKIGKAIATYFDTKKIIVGNDMRFSSPTLKKALINGITDLGCDVIDIGMVDTPALYFATGLLNLPGAIITASHNPIEYNGVKITDKKAVPVGMGSGLEKIKEIVLTAAFKEETKNGIVTEKNILQDYKKHVLSFISIKNIQKLKVVVDAGNGIAGKIVPLIYDSLPPRLTKLYFEITGRFEHHEANPFLDENTKDLRERIKKEKADLGIAFDADMDRVFFIDEKGNFIDSSLISACMISYFSQKIAPTGFVYSLVMSKLLPDLAHQKKLRAYKERVGHAFIKKRMREESAFFGCEHSGHFYYKANWFADSGIITSLIVLEIFSLEKKKNKNAQFSDLFSEFTTYTKIREKSFIIKDKENAYDTILSHFKKLHPQNIDTLDGLTFTFDNYWCNIRLSQTEPVIRLNLEADNEKIMLEKSKEIENFLTIL